MDADSFNANGLAWAVSRWNDEVKHRPLVNVHRRTLDDTWRQVIRYFGGDPDKLIGPSHDTLHMQAQEERAWKPPVHGVKGTYAAEAAVDVLREQGVVDGVKASGLPAWVDGLRDFMERNGKTTEEIGNMLVAAGFATRGVTPSQAPGLAWMVPAMREMAKGLPNSKADALLKWADAIERATRGVGVAPVSEWAEAERIRDLPDVDEAIRNMLEDQTGDNSTCMVRAVLAAAGVAIPLKDQK